MRRLLGAASSLALLLLLFGAQGAAAEEGPGEAVLTPASVICEGDACQGIVLPPDDPLPGTMRSSGHGDPPPSYVPEGGAQKKAKKCRKGFVRRGKRCVSRKALRRAAKRRAAKARARARR